MTFASTDRRDRVIALRNSVYARHVHNATPMRNIASRLIDTTVARSLLMTDSEATNARSYALNKHRSKATKGIFGRLLARHKSGEISVQELINEIEEGDFAFDYDSPYVPLIREHLAFDIRSTPCERCDQIDLRAAADEDGPNYNEVGGSIWCDSCCGDAATYSEVMDCYIESDDAIRYYATVANYLNRETAYNYDVVSQNWADNNAYFQTDGDDNSYCVSFVVMEAWPELFDPDYDDNDNDDDDDDDDDDDARIGSHGRPTGIQSYHSSRPQRIGAGASDGVNMGVELEIVSNSGSHQHVLEFVDAVEAALGSTYYCGFERDGSLENVTTGVEMVTGYGSLEGHREHLATILTDDEVVSALDELTADHDCCGMHIHISADKMTPIHRIKLDAFTLAPANRDTWIKVAGRQGNTYAQYIVATNGSPLPNAQTTKLAAQLAKATLLLAEARPRSWNSQDKSIALRARTAHWPHKFERYRVINWQKGQTAEFRMFQGTIDYATIIARLELVRGLYAFTKATPITCLTWDCFFAWAEQPTNIDDLRGFLTWAAKKGIVPAKDFYKPRLRSWAKPHPVVASKPEPPPPPPPPSREEAEAAAVARLQAMGLRAVDPIAIPAAEISAAMDAVTVPFIESAPIPGPAWPFDSSEPRMSPDHLAIWQQHALEGTLIPRDEVAMLQRLGTQLVAPRPPPLPRDDAADALRYAATAVSAYVPTPTTTSGAYFSLDY